MKKLFSLAIVTIFAASTASAAPIVGFSAPVVPAGEVNNVVIPGGALGSPGDDLAENVLADIQSGGAGLPTNTIDIEITALELVGTTPITFELAPDIFDSHLYRFNLTVNNSVPLDRSIQAIGLEIVGPAFFLNPAGGLGLPAFEVDAPGDVFRDPLSGAYNFQSFNQILLGGLNGGGPGIANGDTDTVSFLVFAPTSPVNSSFDLLITANPEPTSLALGGMALLGLGAVVVRRRRAKSNPSNEETTES